MPVGRSPWHHHYDIQLASDFSIEQTTREYGGFFFLSNWHSSCNPKRPFSRKLILVHMSELSGGGPSE